METGRYWEGLQVVSFSFLSAWESGRFLLGRAVLSRVVVVEVAFFFSSVVSLLYLCLWDGEGLVVGVGVAGWAGGAREQRDSFVNLGVLQEVMLCCRFLSPLLCFA